MDSFFILSLFAFIIYLSISYTLLGHSLLRRQFPSFDDFSFNIFFWRRKSRRVASSILKTYLMLLCLAFAPCSRWVRSRIFSACFGTIRSQLPPWLFLNAFDQPYQHEMIPNAFDCNGTAEFIEFMWIVLSRFCLFANRKPNRKCNLATIMFPFSSDEFFFAVSSSGLKLEGNT